VTTVRRETALMRMVVVIGGTETATMRISVREVGA
jgi:hypothetical protein